MLGVVLLFLGLALFATIVVLVLPVRHDEPMSDMPSGALGWARQVGGQMLSFALLGAVFSLFNDESALSMAGLAAVIGGAFHLGALLAITLRRRIRSLGRPARG